MGWDPTGWDPENWQPPNWQPTASGVVPPEFPCASFRIRPRWIWTAPHLARCRVIEVSESGDYLFPDAYVNPGKQLSVELDLYDLCAAKWLPNRDFTTGQFALPRTPTGFEYEATTAGRSAGVEPKWPRTVGRTVKDGSITWTCRAATGQAIFSLSDASAVEDPGGASISGVSVHASNFRLLATYTGPAEGEEFVAVFTFTLNGQSRNGRQRVIGLTH